MTDLFVLMLKRSYSGEDHRNICHISCFYNLGIADAASGLDDGGDAGIVRGEDAIGEGEEGITGEDGAFGCCACFLEGDIHGIYAAGLAGADADGYLIFYDNNGIALDVFTDIGAEDEVGDLLRFWGFFCDGFEMGFLNDAVVAGLDEEAAGDFPEFGLTWSIVVADFEEAEIFLCGEEAACGGEDGGGYDELEEEGL